MFKVYHIICPITNLPVYIGMTGQSLKYRLDHHYKEKQNIEKYIYLNQMKSFGLIPAIEGLFVSDDSWEARVFEEKLVKTHTANGIKLLNRMFLCRVGRYKKGFKKLF